MLHVGTRKGLFELERGTGGEWKITRVSFRGDPISMLFHDRRDNVMYAAIGTGHYGPKMQRSFDGGATWAEISAPSYADAPAMAARDVPFTNEAQTKMAEKPSLMLIWSLEAAADGGLWCGTAPGGLFYSKDKGMTWTLNLPLWNRPERAQWFGGGYEYPGIHSICVDPRNPKHLTLAISCGGVWHSENNGETWELRGKGLCAEYMPPEKALEPYSQDIHRLVQCPSNPDILWGQHHNGIFVSEDRGRNFVEVKKESGTPSVFGFAVVVHPKDGRKAFFVPGVADMCRIPVDAKLVVTRTRDLGKSFDVLTSGLPQAHAYHLVFRHCMDITEDGQTLAFGTTTGSLFASGDGGERWLRISADLPPIYCVRFA